MEQADNGDDDDGSHDIYGIGVSYDAEMAGMNLGLGLGYQAQEDSANSLGFSVIGSMGNGFSAGISMARTIFDDEASLPRSLQHRTTLCFRLDIATGWIVADR